MAAFEVLALDTATPQIRAPGASDTYTFPRQALFLAGTAGAPGIAQTSDTATGMWWPSASTLAWSSGGSERMRLDSPGNFVFNTAAIATNATDGFLYLSSCAGTPTGTPTAYTGRVPLVINTTNNKLQFYSNGAWQDNEPVMNVVTGTSQTAVANNLYVLTNAAASTVTLPASPTADDLVMVTVGNSLVTNVIARNGQNIMGLAEDMVINDSSATVTLRFVNSTLGWRLI